MVHHLKVDGFLIALIIFTVDGIRKARQAKVERTAADPTAATVEPATALPPR